MESKQTYLMQFWARRIGALGEHQLFRATRAAETKDKARIALYDEFEHIYQVQYISEAEKNENP